MNMAPVQAGYFGSKHSVDTRQIGMPLANLWSDVKTKETDESPGHLDGDMLCFSSVVFYTLKYFAKIHFYWMEIFTSMKLKNGYVH